MQKLRAVPENFVEQSKKNAYPIDRAPLLSPRLCSAEGAFKGLRLEGTAGLFLTFSADEAKVRI